MQKDLITNTLLNPEVILKGDFGELMACKSFPKTPLTQKFLIVVYKEVSKDDGFVLTAYFTNKYSERREVIWKQ